MQSFHEQRSHQRERVQAKVWVRWPSGSGIPTGGRVRAVDASPRGLKVQLEHRVDPFSFVHVECHELKIAGLAIVRHCSRQGMGWVAGLQIGSRSGGRD